MLKRKTSGSVVCPGCGTLVGVRDARCLGCGRTNPALWGFAPALRTLGADLGPTQVVLAGCGVLFVASLLMSMLASGPEGGAGLGTLSPSPLALATLGASGEIPVFRYGRWWTILSASWLHANLIHIAMNMYSAWNVLPIAEHLYGRARTVILYVGAGAAGFLFTSAVAHYGVGIPFFSGASFTVGASASIYGMIGALLHYGRRTGSRVIHQQAVIWAVMMFLYAGFGGPRLDNTAHLGGFIGGYGLSAWMDPLRAERGDHTLVALGLLAASAVAVVASLLVPLQ